MLLFVCERYPAQPSDLSSWSNFTYIRSPPTAQQRYRSISMDLTTISADYHVTQSRLNQRCKGTIRKVSALEWSQLKSCIRGTQRCMRIARS